MYIIVIIYRILSAAGDRVFDIVVIKYKARGRVFYNIVYYYYYYYNTYVQTTIIGV